MTLIMLDVKTTFRNIVRDQSVSICMLQTKVRSSLALTTMAARKMIRIVFTPGATPLLSWSISPVWLWIWSFTDLVPKNTKVIMTNPSALFLFGTSSRIGTSDPLRRKPWETSALPPNSVVVREAIKQVVDHIKAIYPNNFVRVNGITKDQGLKVLRRSKGKDQPWITYHSLGPLPEVVLDIFLKKVPNGFRLPYASLPSECDMEVSCSPSKTTRSE